MMRLPTTLVLLCCAVALLPGHALCADLWGEYGEFAQKLVALDPTPAGESHVGLVDSGGSVQLRFPVPKDVALGYFVSAGNIVAFSGKGSSYQLILRRDSDTGPVIHEGPVIVNGDAWNQDNTRPVDLTQAILDADRERGYIDIFAVGIIKDDGWTIYRSNPARPVLAYAAVPSPELQQSMAAAKAMKDRNVSLIPVPRQMEFVDGEFPVDGTTIIVYPESASEAVAFAAAELRDMILERTGLELAVRASARPMQRQINLGLQTGTWWAALPAGDLAPKGEEGYFLTVLPDGDGVGVIGGGEAGVLYGAMTLGQMIRKVGEDFSLPYCQMTDSPAFPVRIIQYDIARGQTVNVDYVKRVIRQLARCKINALLFYMEDDFRFDKFPFTGREGTFTPAKARELSAYAEQYHMQLIPQFEALGHASAVLAHEELKDLREAGGSWVFCTSEPKTWEFLDAVFGELVEAFPNTDFIHVGGDEFEDGFGKCDRCKAKIEAEGVGGLYSEHMNKLNQLVKKHGKKMQFWPAHWGPTPEFTQMSLLYQDKLEKDCIPTEWIYHGPPSYPEIERYQTAGFEDIYCAPAVESYSRVWPDHTTTFRAIRGFYQAGEERKVGGVYCTTWEFMHGALVENSWYGLIYAAECSWNPTTTSRDEFARRFADLWWGLTGDDAQARMADTVWSPFPESGPAGMWRNGWLVRDIVWCEPARVMRNFSLKQPAVAENAPSLVAAMDAALERQAQMAAAATENDLTLRAMKCAFGLMQYAGRKVVAFTEATGQYKQAADLVAADPAAAAELLGKIAASFTALQAQAASLAEEYREFVDNCGAYKGDLDRLIQQANDFAGLAAGVADLQGKVGAAELKELPDGSEIGILRGTYTPLAEWQPAQMSETGSSLRFDVTPLITADGRVQIEWQYTRGAHALRMHKVQLLRDGEVISEDVHEGMTGASTSGSIYTLNVKDHVAGAEYEVVGEVSSSGGTDSYGAVWLVK